MISYTHLQRVRYWYDVDIDHDVNVMWMWYGCDVDENVMWMWMWCGSDVDDMMLCGCGYGCDVIW